MERAAFEVLAKLAEDAHRSDIAEPIRKRLDLQNKQARMRSSYLKAARRLYHREGALEIDNDAVVSLGLDPGAYVMAWRWVEASDIPRTANQTNVKPLSVTAQREKRRHSHPRGL